MAPIVAKPIEAEAFAPFGQVISADGAPTLLINAERCRRFSDLAEFDIKRGKVGLSLFHSDLCALPVRCELLERHPLGSQCFVPMGGSAYIVVVAEDQDGTPGDPQCFFAAADQAVNIGRNVWHGVLAPISGNGLFAVLDRIGSGANLEECQLSTPLQITPPPGWNRPSDPQ